MLTTCKVELVKGHLCQIEKSKSNEYCHRHQRYDEQDKLVNEGKRLCANFIYGCNTMLKTKFTRCEDCLKKPNEKSVPCSHKDCKNKTYGEKYCGKHYRDIYFEEQEEKGFKYCSIIRGCFKICTDKYTTCEDCRKAKALLEKKARNEIVEKNDILERSGNKEKMCVNCLKLYTPFLTQHNKLSKKCIDCNKYDVEQDAKRPNRIRNYRDENYKHPNTHYNSYIDSAKERKYSFSLSFEEFKDLVIKPCYYCDYVKDEEVNGLDRINNDIGYEKENCVTCCEICNRMKHYYHPLFFIQVCKIISSKIKPSREYFKQWPEYYGRTSNHNFTNYKKTTELKRNIKVNINQSDWDNLTLGPCYLCGYQDAKGIGLDRIDNTIREYSLENIKPCCGTCNDIKNELSLEVLLEKANYISEKWKETSVFENIPKIRNPMREGSRKNEIVENERRIWKSIGVYKDIKSNTNDFVESQVDLEEQEYEDLLQFIQTHDKEECLKYISVLLDILKKRRNKYVKRKISKKLHE